MVDKNSAPSYSITGTRNPTQPRPNALPGPGTYELAAPARTHHSKDIFGKGKRFSQYQSLGPGPGAYQQKITEHAPTAIVLSKSKVEKRQEIPGPGSYEPHYNTILKNNSSCKIGTSEKVADLTRDARFVPGPGQYETARSTLQTLDHGPKFGPERKIELGPSAKTPGPGQYNQTAYYNGSTRNEPKVVFSKSKRSYSLSALGPGPGQYVVKGEIEEAVAKKKGYKIGIKISGGEGDVKEIPGPGAYNSTTNIFKRSTPSFSIGKQPKLKLQNLKEIASKPGPLSYDVKLSALDNRSFAIGKDKRKGLGLQFNIPGPGAYNHKPTIDAKSYTLSKSQRKTVDQAGQTPGPWQYNPKVVHESKYSSIGIGRDQRTSFVNKDLTPGPGDYLKQEKKPTGGFKIGNQKRSKSKEQKLPGPGQYDIPSAIGNVPHYASTSHH